MTLRQRFAFGVSCLVVALLPRAAAGQSSLVTVLFPADDLVIAESSVRLAAELTSAGFGVVKGSCVVEDDQCWSPERAARSKAAEIVLWRANASAKILVTYWKAQDTAVQKRFTVSAFGPTSNASVLAIQAFDLFQLAAGLNVVTRDAPTVDAAAKVVEASRPRFALELGGAVLPSFPSFNGGLGVAAGPAVQVWLLYPRQFALALSVVGPAHARQLESAKGSASVRQESASLLACYRPFPDARLQPSLCGGAGIYHAAVEGRASQTNQSASRGHWTGFADVGLGALVPLGSSFTLGFQARAWWLKRYPQILIGGDQVGETGKPSLLLVASVGRVF